MSLLRLMMYNKLAAVGRFSAKRLDSLLDIRRNGEGVNDFAA